MSLIQFWRIIWARRLLIVAATLSCALGAYVVTLVVPPRWEAHARVLLNLLTPDPVTGETVGGSATGTYVASQTEFVEDYSVSGLAVDRLGWEHDPEFIAKYRARPAKDRRDLRHWLAQTISDHTKADVVEGSNILDITYTAETPEGARVIADALRQAYLDASLALRRANVNRNADWFADQAVKAKAALDDAGKKESDFERANNVYMATDTLDLDSARLAALAAQNGENTLQNAAGSSAASVQLAEVNAEIAQISQTLGPNHPQLLALQAKRASLTAIAAREHASAVTTSRKGGATSALDAQAAIVSSKHDALAKLKQLQAEVDLRRDLYNKASAKAAELRQQAAIEDVGLTPLGAVIVPSAPSFPKMTLIMLGSFGLGLTLGVLIGVLVEMLRRRVRGLEDLQWATEAPVLAVVRAPTRAH